MKFDRKWFLQQIETAARCASKDHPVEILRGLCFRGGLLLSYNQKCGSVQKCSIDADAIVAIDKLVPVVKSLECEQIDVSVKGSVLHVKGGKTSVKIPTADVKGFPHFLPKEKTVYYRGSDFGLACNSVLFCVASHKTLPALGGVGIRGNYVYGANPGARIARTKLTNTALRPAVITVEGVQELNRCDECEEILIDKTTLHAIWKDPPRIALFGTLHDSQYPFNTLDGVFDKMLDPAYDMPVPAGLLAALNRVLAPIAKSKNQVPLTVIMSEGTMNLSISEDGVEAEENITCEKKHNSHPHHIGFVVTASYFKEAVATFKTMNVADVVTGGKRVIGFRSERLEHVLALRSS